MNTAENILTFWFGCEFADGFPLRNRDALWFQSNHATDRKIRTTFAADVERAAVGQLDNWLQEPRSRLAFIILLDQFPRNIYRGTPHAFGYDDLACDACRTGLKLGHDSQLRPIERIFFYLPLEHSESLAMQDLSVELITSMLDNATPRQQSKIQSYLNHARNHREIIKRFGRFPHRNSILGRSSTNAELEYLKAGSSFGQG